jgi:hypothetical protein
VPENPRAPRDDDDFEAPTLKRNIPAELRDEPGATMTTQVTTRLPRAEIEALLTKEREKSGTRRAISHVDIESVERYERRELRETLPAPPASPPVSLDDRERPSLDADDKG